MFLYKNSCKQLQSDEIICIQDYLNKKVYIYTMKNLIFILFLTVFCFCSCKKTETKPTYVAPVNDQILLNFRIFGFKVIDTSEVYFNGEKLIADKSAYHMSVKKGDVIDFYYSGQLNVNQQECNFAAWKDENAQISESIKYYTCQVRKVFKKVLRPNSSQEIFTYNYYVTGKYTVQ